MPFLAAGIDEYVRQLGIQRAAPIPCAARSLTLEEARGHDRGSLLWGVSVVGFFSAMYLVIVGQAENPPVDHWKWAGGTFGFLVAFLALSHWLRVRKRRDYADPRIRVEAGEHELVVAGPAGRDSRPYEAVVVSEILSVATKSSRSFTGIVLDTRLGKIRLEDEFYTEARPVAGAILKRLESRPPRTEAQSAELVRTRL